MGPLRGNSEVNMPFSFLSQILNYFNLKYWYGNDSRPYWTKLTKRLNLQIHKKSQLSYLNKVKIEIIKSLILPGQSCKKKIAQFACNLIICLR